MSWHRASMPEAAVTSVARRGDDVFHVRDGRLAPLAEGLRLEAFAAQRITHPLDRRLSAVVDDQRARAEWLNQRADPPDLPPAENDAGCAEEFERAIGPHVESGRSCGVGWPARRASCRRFSTCAGD